MFGLKLKLWFQISMSNFCDTVGFKYDFLKQSYVQRHRPYSRQVTEWMECDFVIHPPPTVYPKAGNGALLDQWAIKYHCQNDSPTIAFTVRDLVH